MPLPREAMTPAVARGDVQFVLTHPGHYVELANGYGIAAIATMQHWWRNTPQATAGAAIIVRADRADIAWMSDLKGKSFMAVSPDAFAGFQLAWWELQAHDVDPFRDFSHLVRTDARERLAGDGVWRSDVIKLSG